jgi:hypothetical protein
VRVTVWLCKENYGGQEESCEKGCKEGEEGKEESQEVAHATCLPDFARIVHEAVEKISAASALRGALFCTAFLLVACADREPRGVAGRSRSG